MSNTVEIRVSPTSLEAGDAALVNRGGAPAMVVLGTAAAADAGDFATEAHGHTAGDVSGLAAVATSGAYADLTGTQAISTVDGLQSALDARVLVVDADGDETTARPGGAAVVMWINSPELPTNAAPGDLWFEAD